MNRSAARIFCASTGVPRMRGDEPGPHTIERNTQRPWPSGGRRKSAGIAPAQRLPGGAEGIRTPTSAVPAPVRVDGAAASKALLLPRPATGSGP